MKFIQFEQTVFGTEQRGKGKFMWKELVVILKGKKAAGPLQLICFSLKRNT